MPCPSTSNFTRALPQDGHIFVPTLATSIDDSIAYENLTHSNRVPEAAD